MLHKFVVTAVVQCSDFAPGCVPLFSSNHFSEVQSVGVGVGIIFDQIFQSVNPCFRAKPSKTIRYSPPLKFLKLDNPTNSKVLLVTSTLPIYLHHIKISPTAPILNTKGDKHPSCSTMK